MRKLGITAFISIFLAFLAFKASAEEAFKIGVLDLEILVKRGDKTLPLAKVPQLKSGDRLLARPLNSDDSKRLLFVIGTLIPEKGAWNEEIQRAKFGDGEANSPLELVVKGENQIPLFVVGPYIDPWSGSSFDQVVDFIRDQPQGVIFGKSDELKQLAEVSVAVSGIAHIVEALATAPDLKNRKQRVENFAKIAGISAVDSKCFKDDGDVHRKCVVTSLLNNVASAGKPIDPMKVGDSILQLVGSRLSDSAQGTLALVGALLQVWAQHQKTHEFLPVVGNAFGNNVELLSTKNMVWGGKHPTAYLYLPPTNAGAKAGKIQSVTWPDLCDGRPVVDVPIELRKAFSFPFVDGVSIRSDQGTIAKATIDVDANSLRFAQSEFVATARPGSAVRVEANWGFETIALGSAVSRSPMAQPIDSKYLVGETKSLNSPMLVGDEVYALPLREGASACIKGARLVPRAKEVSKGGPQKARDLEVTSAAINVQVKDVTPGPWQIVIENHGQQTKQAYDVRVVASNDVSVSKAELPRRSGRLAIEGKNLQKVLTVEIGGVLFQRADLEAIRLRGEDAGPAFTKPLSRLSMFAKEGQFKDPDVITTELPAIATMRESTESDLKFSVAIRPALISAEISKSTVSPLAMPWGRWNLGEQLLTSSQDLTVELVRKDGVVRFPNDTALYFRAFDADNNIAGPEVAASPMLIGVKIARFGLPIRTLFPGNVPPFGDIQWAIETGGRRTEWKDLGKSVVRLPEISKIDCATGAIFGKDVDDMILQWGTTAKDVGDLQKCQTGADCWQMPATRPLSTIKVALGDDLRSQGDFLPELALAAACQKP